MRDDCWLSKTKRTNLDFFVYRLDLLSRTVLYLFPFKMPKTRVLPIKKENGTNFLTVRVPIKKEKKSVLIFDF